MYPTSIVIVECLKKVYIKSEFGCVRIPSGLIWNDLKRQNTPLEHLTTRSASRSATGRSDSTLVDLF